MLGKEYSSPFSFGKLVGDHYGADSLCIPAPSLHIWPPPRIWLGKAQCHPFINRDQYWIQNWDRSTRPIPWSAPVYYLWNLGCANPSTCSHHYEVAAACCKSKTHLTVADTEVGHSGERSRTMVGFPNRLKTILMTRVTASFCVITITCCSTDMTSSSDFSPT